MAGNRSMATYATTLLADLTFLHNRLNDLRYSSEESEDYEIACAFSAIYLSANAKSIEATLHHIYKRSEAELKAADPYPNDRAWRHSHCRDAELALAVSPRPPKFDIDEDSINMLRRAIRIAEALNISPGDQRPTFTLFLSPAKECFEALGRAGNLEILFMHEDGSGH